MHDKTVPLLPESASSPLPSVWRPACLVVAGDTTFTQVTWLLRVVTSTDVYLGSYLNGELNRPTQMLTELLAPSG